MDKYAKRRAVFVGFLTIVMLVALALGLASEGVGRLVLLGFCVAVLYFILGFLRPALYSRRRTRE